MIKKYTNLVQVFPGNFSGGHSVSFLAFGFSALENKRLLLKNPHHWVKL